MIWHTWMRLRWLAFVLLGTGPLSRAFANDAGSAAAPADFVPFDPSLIDSVDGKLMMILAYGIIALGIVLYSISLWTRQRQVQRAALDLETRVQHYSTTLSKTQQ